MKKDILKAIEVEKEYLKYKLNGESTFNLIDEIKKCEFETLEEYFNNKKEYLFKQLNFKILKTTPSKCIYTGLSMLAEKITGVFFCDTSDTIVYTCQTKPYNKKYCEDNNITVYTPPIGGGTIVSSKGDLVIGICTPVSIQIDTRFILEKFANILNKYIDNIEIVDNDIIVDNGKVCGISYLQNNNMVIHLVHFSFSDTSDLINEICHTNSKPIKIPSYIIGLDRDTFKEEVIKCLQST